MFYLITRRKINLVRLILDFILLAVNAERRRHATLPYGMFLTRVFIQAQLPINGHRTKTKRPIITMKIFSTLGLKLQALEKGKGKEKKKEIEKENEDKKKKDSFEKNISAQKHKSKPSKEDKKKKK